MAFGKWKKGFYVLNNRNKYLGDPTKVIYRSSWEQDAFKVCDNNPNVLEWAAEFIRIPYLVPNRKTGNPQMKTYIPDIYAVTRGADGVVNRLLIEIKPLKQTKPSRSRNPAVRLYEQQTFAINKLKWAAAQEWCDSRNIQFILSTEKDIFGNRGKR